MYDGNKRCIRIPRFTRSSINQVSLWKKSCVFCFFFVVDKCMHKNFINNLFDFPVRSSQLLKLNVSFIKPPTNGQRCPE